MKPRFRQMLLVLVLAAISFLCWTVYAQGKKSSTVVWEYNVFAAIGDNTDRLSVLGAQGWELISVRTEDEMVGNFRQVKVFYYLKRAKQIH